MKKSTKKIRITKSQFFLIIAQNEESEENNIDDKKD